MYYIVYVADSTPTLKKFKTKVSMKKFIKQFPTDKDNGYWLDFAFKGSIEYTFYESWDLDAEKS